ncbi:hypothetical protein GWI33_006957 [Rhynchophorus ferrugineus]|uniref:Uncharacterized protein n=1 Tax=Rhynchophorus ferrugineus TaxID=354439 RepID=A0A834IAE5_RHYFE|nr:hypothetical protein GWI33_006957 [Rhynchophorus ferrugineus]
MDLENNSSQKKYTVNQNNDKGLVISKALCTLMAIGAILLAVLVGLIVFFLVPRGCSGDAQTPTASLIQNNTPTDNGPKMFHDSSGVSPLERLPRSIKPIHYM